MLSLRYYVCCQSKPTTETGYTMDVIITVNYRVHLEDEDAENIENGTMDIHDIDWSYYADNYNETELVDVWED